LGGGCPFQAKMTEGGFVSHNEKVEGHKVRTRSKSFNDFFSQATLFFKSQTAVEQQHMIDALGFELGKVETIAIRTRMVGLLSLIDDGMAKKVAKQLGIDYPVTIEKPINQGVPADAGATEFEPTSKKQSLKSSDALSMLKNLVPVLMSRQVAILCDEEVDEKSLIDLKKALEAKKVMVKIIAPRSGKLKLKSGKEINIDHSFLTTDSVLFDGVIVADGKKSTDALQKNIHAIHFLNESYRHCKPIGIFGSGKEVWQKSMFAENKDNKTSSFSQAGIFIDKNAEQFMKGLEMHRFWEREKNL
jgi:catalase